MYTFVCRSKRHEDEGTRSFVATVHRPEGKAVDQIQCPECGGLAKRDLVADLKTVSAVGSTPISHSTTVTGSLANSTEFAFGRFKKNPDGSEDMNHRPFRDTGELERFVNGANDLGPPKINPRTGQPMRRPDGSMIRTGAKLVKFDRNRRPPVNKKPAYTVPDAWVDGDTVTRTSANARNISLRDAGVNPAHYKSPERRAK